MAEAGSGTLPRMAAPSEKVMVAGLGRAAAEVTVALKVMVWPMVAGFGRAERTVVMMGGAVMVSVDVAQLVKLAAVAGI